jgi:nucleotide exchange factor SIL1
MLALALLALPVWASASSASSAPPSGVEMICHTDNPAECYPKIFQPTTEFQKVHDDQDLPPGLHVRMDIWSGVKEARLNVDDGEENPALAGMPVDRAVVVVEREEEEEAEGGNKDDEGKAGGNFQRPPRKDAPAYDPVGKIKPPAGGAEPQFAEALGLFRRLGYNPTSADDKTATVEGALEELRELAHDGYYGMMIMADKEAVRGLMCMMLSGDDKSGGRGQEAAYVVAGALSNNPKAVAELVANWAETAREECRPGEGEIGKRIYAGFVGEDSDGGAGGEEEEARARLAKARVAALNGMLEDVGIRDDFLQAGGMRALLEVVARANAQREKEGGQGGVVVEAWEAAARRTGQLVLDRFLDAEMGATLGVWPRVDMRGEGECRTDPEAAQEGGPDEGCWRYVVGRARDAGSGSWSGELWDRLGEAGEKTEHVEL